MSEHEKEPLHERFDRLIKRLMGYKKRRDPRKEEKPIFATFQDRVVASVLDTGFIYLLFQEVFRFISSAMYRQIDVQAVDEKMAQAPPTTADAIVHIRYAVETAFASGFAQLWLLNSFAQSIVIGLILVFIWQEFHTTPGKYIIGLRFAGRHGEDKPTLRQYIIRYLGFYLSMPVFMIGFALLGIDKEKRAWHDRMAGTTVIYSKRGSIFRQGWDILKRQFKK